MRRILFGFALAAAGCGAQPDEQALRDANRRYDQAIVAGDRAALERILAPDYVYISGEGQVKDRTGAIRDLTSGQIRIASNGSEDVRVRWFGEHALVTGRFRARVTFGGQEYPIDERYSSIWSPVDGAWQLRHEHASMAPQPSR